VNPYQVIRRPLITEKSVYLQNATNTWAFEVHQDANKTQIREAVERLFKVKVLSVHTMNCRGKDRRMRGGAAGVSAAWKKAFVRLPADQRIEGI